MIVAVEGIHRLAESSFPEVEMPTMGSLTVHCEAESYSVCVCVCVCICVCVRAQTCLALCDPMEPTRLPCPWNFPGKNTGVGCHFLSQGIFKSRD